MPAATLGARLATRLQCSVAASAWRCPPCLTAAQPQRWLVTAAQSPSPDPTLPSSSASAASSVSSSSAPPTAAFRPATAVVMLNMGGPSTIPEVGPFLHRLFSDGEIITLGRLQSTLGPFIASRRTPRIEKQYAAIGGSPIRRWTELQGRMLAARLDVLNPATAPHRCYTMFRYAEPLTEETLQRLQAEGVRRCVAFSQYPQFSCTTTGSSLNQLWRELRRLGMTDAFRWSLIDRWPTHPAFIAAVAQRVTAGLQRFPAADRHRVVIIFSAHSLPMRVVNRGDPYTAEVAATVSRVMDRLRADGLSNAHALAWQSQVGFLPWMGPQTGELISGLGRQGHRLLLVVPVAFTSDHVETLYEIDVEYREVAHKAGIAQFERSESLNAGEPIADAMAAIVSQHLSSGSVCSADYPLNCAHCTNPLCRSIISPIAPYHRLRDAPLTGGPLSEKSSVVNEDSRLHPNP